MSNDQKLTNGDDTAPVYTPPVDQPTGTTKADRPPDQRDIDLLLQVVLRAQNDVSASISPRNALLEAYRIVLAEQDIDIDGDEVCIGLLGKVVDAVVVGDGADTEDNTRKEGSLYEAFEKVLRDEGIELTYDDDLSTREVSEVGVKSPVRHVVQRPIPRQPVSPQTQRDTYGHLNTKPEAVDELDLYMDNPPPYVGQLMRMAERMDKHTLIRQTLSQLRSRGVAAMERRADAYYHNLLLQKVISQWTNVVAERSADYIKADEYYAGKLRDRTVTKLANSARIQRVQAMEEVRLKGVGLYKMTLAARESHFTRKIERRIKTKFLRTLLSRLRAEQERKRHLEIALQQRSTILNVRSAQVAISMWTDKASQVKNMTENADAYAETRSKQIIMRKWYNSKSRIEEQRLTADQLRKYFLMRKYIQKIKYAVQAKRQRRAVLIKWTITRWRQFTESSKQKRYNEGYKIARRNHKHRIAREALRAMFDECRRVKTLEQIAAEREDLRIRRVAHAGVVSWYNSAMAVQQMDQTADQHAKQLALKHAFNVISSRASQTRALEGVADQYNELHVKQVAGKALKQMSKRAFDVQRKSQTADAYRSRQDRRLTRMMLDRWRVGTADKRGEGPLRLPPATPAQKRAEEMFRLTSTTPRYTPARGTMSFTARLRGEAANMAITTMRDRIIEEDEEDEVEISMLEQKARA